MPEKTVLDGEIVAFDDPGKPSFNTLQNAGSSPSTPRLFYVFDVLMLAGKDVMGEPLEDRRRLLETKVLPKLAEPVRYSPELKGSLKDVIGSVKTQELEGFVAKRRNSVYEPGRRSGAWQKMRVNQGQELVIGGCTTGGETFDALVLGYFQDGKLMYASRTRNGLTPVIRAQLLKNKAAGHS